MSREEIVQECFEWAVQHGRVHREDYPVLKEFSVGTATCGGDVTAEARVPVRVAWKTSSPLQTLRLIADGITVAAPLKGDPLYGLTEGVWETELDLREARYVRLEIDAYDPGTPERRDSLCGNPVYVRS